YGECMNSKRPPDSGGRLFFAGVECAAGVGAAAGWDPLGMGVARVRWPGQLRLTDLNSGGYGERVAGSIAGGECDDALGLGCGGGGRGDGDGDGSVRGAVAV